MDISVLIVNYNTKYLLNNCIRSIERNTSGIDYEIIVIDNASSDGTVNMLITEFPNIQLITNSINLGFAKANNIGSNYAKGEYLLFLNSDTLLLNNALLYFYEFFKNNFSMKLGALGGLLLDTHKIPIHSSSNFPTKIRLIKNILSHYFNPSYFKNNYRGEKLDFTLDSYFEVDYITGADLFIPKSVFTKLDGFDSNYFMYFEDVDLQFKLKHFGLKRLIIKGPEIIHLEGRSEKRESYAATKRVQHEKSMFLYFKKHSNYYSYYAFRLAYFILRIAIIFDRRLNFHDRLIYLRSLILI